MERLVELAVVAVDVLVELIEREGDLAHEGREAARLDLGHRLIVSLPPDRLPLDDVARIEEAHEVAKVADLLVRIVDRHGRDAEHLIPARSSHRIDAAETPAVADGQLRRIRPWTEV